MTLHKERIWVCKNVYFLNGLDSRKYNRAGTESGFTSHSFVANSPVVLKLSVNENYLEGLLNQRLVGSTTSF